MSATAVVPFEKAAVPAHIQAAFAGRKNDDIYRPGGVPSVSFRGKVWRYSLDGEEVTVNNADGDPAASIEVILLKSNPRYSKAYFKGAYVEGDNQAPTCASMDGLTPVSNAVEPQCETCAACQWNVVGSRITDQNKKAKACGDKRRLAIVPADMSTKPLLLNLPPTSVWDRDNAVNEAKGWYALSQYGDYLNKRGVHYSAVVTKLGFDSRPAHPKVLFKAVRFLSDEEVAKSLALAESQEVSDILTGTHDTVTVAAPAAPAKPALAAVKTKAIAPPATAPDTDGDDAPPAATTTTKPATPAPAARSKPAAKPKPATVVAADADVDAALAAILGAPADDDTP